MRRAPALREGDKIGVFAPSSRTDKATIDKARGILEAKGYEVFIHPQTFAENGQSAGTPEEKVAAFHDLIRDEEIKAVIAARGGNRAGYILPLIDYDLVKENPKIIMGFSDITTILHAIYKETDLATFHGPMMLNIAEPLPEGQLEDCLDLLSGKRGTIKLPGAHIVRHGMATGRLMGGNLSLLCSLMGTKWQPDLNGTILFLEDHSDEISRYDRMLLQLRNAGILENLSGLVIGQFTDTSDNSSKPFGFTLEDIVKDLTAPYDYPVLMNAPFGHGDDLYTLPVGMHATMTAHNEKADDAAIKLTEQPVTT